MPSTKNWWVGKIDWETPAGQLLTRFLAALPKDRTYQLILYGSAPLQLTLDRELMSGDVDLFSDGDDDLAALIDFAQLGKAHGGLYLEPGFELSFRTSPRWRHRAVTVELGHVKVTIPHPLDILIGKLARLDAKDLTAFRRVYELTGHPTPAELLSELQQAVDLFRPAFDEDAPNRYSDNTQILWHELYGAEIDVRHDIIAPAIDRRRRGYGEVPPDYKQALGE